MGVTPIKPTSREFCQLPKSVLPHELIDGELRLPAAPNPPQQEIHGNVYRPLHGHVRARDLGRIWMAPIDVVLHQAGPLVLQPDVRFVRRERLPLARDKVYGAPDLTVEIFSGSGVLSDRPENATFYGQYGGRDYWLVDPESETVEVRRLEPQGLETFGILRGGEMIQSTMLPDLHLPVDDVFAA